VSGELAGALVAVGWRPFDEGARRVLATLSSQVAIALVNARAVAAERELMREAARREAAIAAQRAEADGLRRAVEAQEAERTRVARELHDEAGQVLTALAVHLRALESEVGDGPLRERLAELRRSVGTATASVRDLATSLRPTSLRELGLTDAIEEQAARVRAGGVAVDVDLRGISPDLPEDVQTVLFRVVQEALTNTVRHSGARTASIVASARGGRLRLVVEDDGTGFDPAHPTSRLGLAGIRERVALIGARLRIESSPGGGTAVMVDVDLPG
jgi:signal transduction histidine kinase